MKPGFNAIRVTAEQRHRVDCSLEATYELWTQIDPTQTGLMLPRADPGVTMIADLAAIPIDEQGALPIRAITPQRADMGSVERIIRAAQMISLLGRFAQPVVDFGSLAQGEHGINLAVGPVDELRAQLDGLPLPHVQGPRVVVLPRSEGRRTTIVATGAHRRGSHRSAAAVRASPPAARARREGLRAAAAFPGYRLGGGQRVRLRDLGVSSQEFSGRLFRAAFNLILPPDFYSADYGKATLDLAGGYAPGLGVGSQIIVSVNGRHVMSQQARERRATCSSRTPCSFRSAACAGPEPHRDRGAIARRRRRSCDTLAAIPRPSASCSSTRRKSNCRRSRASRACPTSR